MPGRTKERRPETKYITNSPRDEQNFKRWVLLFKFSATKTSENKIRLISYFHRFFSKFPQFFPFLFAKFVDFLANRMKKTITIPLTDTQNRQSVFSALFPCLIKTFITHYLFHLCVSYHEVNKTNMVFWMKTSISYHKTIHWINKSIK